MIVYVEANFILELARRQEEAESAETILQLAEEHIIELAFPAFALWEPHNTLINKDKERTQLQNLLQLERGQLGRSTLHGQVTEALDLLLGEWLSVGKTEMDIFENTVEQLLTIGRSLETDKNVFREAVVYRNRLPLSLQDSIVYAAIVGDLRQRPHTEIKCFLSKDKKAFSDQGAGPDIEKELESYNCRYVPRFIDGLELY